MLIALNGKAILYKINLFNYSIMTNDLILCIHILSHIGMISIGMCEY